MHATLLKLIKQSETRKQIDNFKRKNDLVTNRFDKFHTVHFQQSTSTHSETTLT